MGKTQEITVRRSLNLSDEEDIWLRYESIGNAAEVGKGLSLPYHVVMGVLNRDRIRKRAIQVARAEDMASRWEAQESKSAAVCGQLLDVVSGMLAHVKECIDNGNEYTDLCAITVNGPLKLTPTQAYQWIIEKRVMDMAQKVGMTGAKICEGMRQMYRQDSEVASGADGDPKTMTDEELRRLIGEIESAGHTVPWAVSQWKRGQPPADPAAS